MLLAKTNWFFHEQASTFRPKNIHSLRLNCHSTCPLPQRILLSKRKIRLYKSHWLTKTKPQTNSRTLRSSRNFAPAVNRQLRLPRGRLLEKAPTCETYVATRRMVHHENLKLLVLGSELTKLHEAWRILCEIQYSFALGSSQNPKS